MDIRQLAETRALCAAKLEHLGQMGDSISTDKEERIALLLAVRDAEQAYRIAERDYQRAIATLTPEELEAVLRRKEQAA